MKTISSRLTAIALGVTSLAALGGCASYPSSQPVSNDSGYTRTSQSVAYGTVDSIQLVQSRSAPGGAGAVAGGLVGALLGNQIGSGGGRTAATVAGAVGGAVVGNKIEEQRGGTRDSYQISVRMDNGDYRIFTQDSVADLRVGSRARVIDGRVYRD